MTSAELGRTIRQAGKSFLAARLGDLYERRLDLESESGIEKITDAYYRKQFGHHDKSKDETRERILLAKRIIDEDMTVECLDILAYTKSLDAAFTKKAKEALKKLSV